MLAATLSTACCGILRAFRAYGIGLSIGQDSIFIFLSFVLGLLTPHPRNLRPCVKNGPGGSFGVSTRDLHPPTPMQKWRSLDGARATIAKLQGIGSRQVNPLCIDTARN